MTNLGSFTFKNGLLKVKSRVLSIQGFATAHGLSVHKNGKDIIMPDCDKKYEEIRDVLLQAGYAFT